MSDRTYAFLTALIGVICGYVIIKHLFFFANSMSLRNDLVQGFFVGFGLAIVSIEIYAEVKSTRIMARSPCSDTACPAAACWCGPRAPGYFPVR